MPNSRQLGRVASRNFYGAARSVANRASAYVRANPFVAANRARRAARVMRNTFKRWKTKYSNKYAPKKSRKSHPDSTHLAAGHSGFSADNIRVKPRTKLRKLQKLVGHWRYQQTHQWSLTSSAGTQGKKLLCTVASNAQLFTSTGSGYSEVQNATALEQMNPFKTNTGSSVLVSSATAANDRFMLRNCAVKMLVTNFSVVAAEVDIYCLTPKILTNQDPVTAWDNRDDAFGLAIAGGAGPGAGSVGTFGGNNTNIPFVHPHDNSRFRVQWRICAVKSMRLEGNSTERCNFDLTWNKVIQKNKYVPQNFLYIPNVTYAFMAVWKGALVLDTTTATHAPTIGSTSLGWVGVPRYVMSAVKDNAGRLDSQAMIDNLTAPVLANQSLINEVDAPIAASAGTQL